MKYDLDGKIMNENVCCIETKTYSYLRDNNDKDRK